MSLKLHLGCGTKHIKGYTNIDIRYLPKVDEVNNIKFLRNYKENTVDTIYACHVLEHFSRWDYENVLRRWYEILKPGGILRVAVPNFESVCEYYNITKNLQNVMGILYGGQDYNENFHYVIFDTNTLSSSLQKIGFKNIKKYNWQETEHSEVDDYSKAYIPHMDQTGLLMSLNIECQK
jgi:predicted SAM-dependent methyltransferase